MRSGGCWDIPSSTDNAEPTNSVTLIVAEFKKMK